MSRKTILFSLCLLWIPSVAPARTVMTANGPALTVETNRFRVEFRGGVVVGLSSGGERFVSTGSTDPGSSATTDDAPDAAPVEDAAGPGMGTWKAADGSATYTKEWDGGTYSFRVRVDEKTGDLVLSQKETSRAPGLRSTSWRIAGLRLGDGMRLILPSNGGVAIDRDTLFRQSEFTYPFGWPDWSSQLAIVEGKGKSLAIRSTDRNAEFKRLRLERRGKETFDLQFHTENPAPFSERTEAESVEWRINVFDGDWRTPASEYQDWMREAFDLRPWEEEAEWARNVRAVVGIRGRDVAPEFLDELAARLVPERTLIYVPDWRTHGYDVYYPDYTPGDYIAGFIDEAHKRGFHVMLHVNLPGISPRHPLYEEFKQWHTKDPLGVSYLGWYWEKQVPVTHAFIDPASSKYREHYVSLMKDVIAETGADALHLDVSSPMWNDGGGLIEGMNYPRGSMALHRALRRALPETVFGGEGINEITLTGERFYQKWEKRGVGEPHPIESFLYGPYARPVGYLGLPNPDESPGGYNAYARDYESWGVLPTIFADVRQPSELDRPRTRSLLTEAKAWQENLLAPDFSRPWKESEKFVWKGEGGAEAVLEKEPSGSVRMRIGDDVYYERIRNRTQWETRLVIPSWPAYDGARYIGLDPGMEYEALPVERVEPPVQVRGLPPGWVLEEYRADTESAVVLPATRARRLDRQFALALLTGETGTTIGGTDGPLEKGARFDIHDGPSGPGGDIVFASICPWHPVGDEQDKAWGEVFAEASLSFPKPAAGKAAPRGILRFDTAIAESALQGDGSTFRVEVNGREVFSEWRKDTRWKEHAVPVGELAGKVRVRFILNPGPNDSVSYDLGLWRNPRLDVIQSRAGENPQGEVVLRTRPGISVRSTILTAKNAAVERDRRDIACETAPGAPIVLFFGDAFPVEGETLLTEAPVTFGVEGLGVYTPNQRAWGSGSIMEATTDEGTFPGFSGHPPSNGKTCIRQVVRVGPDIPEPRLRFIARVNEGAVTGGVGFSVLLDGREEWSWTTAGPGWEKGEIPLAGHVGEPLLIEWVTDSLGDAYYDWAIWLDPRIVGGGNQEGGSPGETPGR